MKPSKPDSDSPLHGLLRYLPILQWLPQYQLSWLRADIIAGLLNPPTDPRVIPRNVNILKTGRIRELIVQRNGKIFRLYKVTEYPVVVSCHKGIIELRV